MSDNNFDDLFEKPKKTEETSSSLGFDDNLGFEPPKKKKRNKKAIAVTLISLLLIGGGTGGFVAYNKLSTPVAPQKQEMKSTAYTNYLKDLNSGSLNKDLYLSREIEFFNSNEKRQALYEQVILPNLTFIIPSQDYKASIGNKKITDVASLNNVETVDVYSIDYDKLSNLLLEYYKDDIENKFKESGIKEDDYDFKNEMIDFFSEYLTNMQASLEEGYSNYTSSISNSDENATDEKEDLNKTSVNLDEPQEEVKTFVEESQSKELSNNFNNPLFLQSDEITRMQDYGFPLIKTEVKLDTEKVKGKYEVVNDSELDDLLFSSEQFHSLLDSFSRIALGYNTYSQTEEWTQWLEEAKEASADKEKMEKETEELTAKMNEVQQKIYEADNDKDKEQIAEDFYKESSGAFRIDARTGYITTITKGLDEMRKTEPVRYSVNKVMSQEDLVKYESLIKENKDLGDLKNQSKPYVSESVIPYNWIGSNYLLNTTGEDGKPIFSKPPLGTGAIDNPLSFDTPVITSAIDRANKQNPVRVTLKEVLTGKEAIDYVINKDDRNKGLDVSSEIELAIFLFDVENLEDNKIKVFSELTLTDTNRTNVSRTGKVYGLAEEVEIQPHETVHMEDWVYSTTLDNRYAIWGKTFERETEPVWLRVLKGKDGIIKDNMEESTNDSTE